MSFAKIADIDKNFKVETTIERDNLQFYDVENKPFQVYGLMREKGRFCRIPEQVAHDVSEWVHILYSNTAGGRVRFVTDSPYIAISAEMDNIGKMPHFPLTGSAGFDLHVDEGNGQKYFRSFVPPYEIETGYESVHDFSNQSKRIVTIHFPLYSGVKKVYVGLSNNCSLEAAPDYAYEKPVVYYGSSITQGGCASTPGNSYQNMISRWLNVDHINLGFSGSAKAEDAMVQYLANLDMRLFVCDYDHNAPNADYLRKTHLPLYRHIRAEQPDLPILFISSPSVLLTPEKYQERQRVVQETYQIAISEGDKNVYYLDGADLFAGDDWDLCTVDGIHPNDLGFYRMAKKICAQIAKIL